MSPTPHRVLMAHRDLPISGGICHSFLSIAGHVNRDKMLPTVFSLEPVPDESRATFEKSNTPVHAGGKGIAKQLSGFRAAIRDSRADLVCCASFRTYVLAKWIQRRLGFRTLFWVRGIPIMTSPWKRWLFRRLARNDTLLAISEAALKAHTYPGHRGRQLVSYNGVSPAPASAANPADRKRAREALGLDDGDLAVGYVAEFTGWKDHVTLLKAVRALAADRPEIKLLLFGTGEEEAAVRERAESLGDRVKFMGVRPDVRELLAGLDVYAHPARAEAFGRAVAEAMLAALPVVAARAGSLPELIEHEATGLTFKAGDPADLREALTLLSSDRTLRDRIASAAAESAAARFGAERAAREFESVVDAEMDAGTHSHEKE